MSSSAASAILEVRERRERDILEDWLRNLQDLNSQFSATREFLMLQGLEHVSQLDQQGLKDLEEHLIKVRNRLLN